MTCRYSTAIVCLRALATVESKTTLILSYAPRTPPGWLLAAVASTSPARPSSSLTSKSLRFSNIRPLKLQPLQHQPQHFNLDLTREGLDFSLWEIEVVGGFSLSQYEYIRHTVEDGLNTLSAAGLVSKDASAPQNQDPLFERAKDTASVGMTTDQQETRITVVATYDTDLEHDASAECKLRKNKRLLTLSKTVPVVDALQGAGSNVPAASSPASNDKVD
ncbi:hypothetical protein MBLNU13_g08194t1 [Cladosporium sp. NU13]